MNTSLQYDEVISQARDIFTKKNKDYGSAWKILRPSSLTDQIYIKAARIRTIEENENQRVSDGKEEEYIGIINYCVMAILQLADDNKDPDLNMSTDVLLQDYNNIIDQTKKLMQDKNHDYGEAWREMRTSSMTDLILMKLLRIRQIEDNDGKTIISEGLDANYQDILNYSVFSLIQLTEQKTNS